MQIKQQMQAAYVDTWNSCPPMMEAKVKALPNCQQINDDKDAIQLGLKIRAIACGVETSNNKIFTTVQLSKMLHIYHQEQNVSDHQYLKNFEGLVRAIEQQGGTLCQMPAQVHARTLQIAAQNGRANNPNEADEEEAEGQINEEIKAAYFLSGAYSVKHGNMKAHLNNLYLTGNRDAYPTTVADAMQLMEGWRLTDHAPRQQQHQRDGGGGDDGLSFAQAGLAEEELGEDDEQPATAQNSALKSCRKKNKRKKNKVKFDNDNTRDAAGNKVISHQSHAMTGEEEEADPLEEEAQEEGECPHCNGSHTLADCPDLSLEQPEEFYAQLGTAQPAKRAFTPSVVLAIIS